LALVQQRHPRHALIRFRFLLSLLDPERAAVSRANGEYSSVCSFTFQRFIASLVPQSLGLGQFLGVRPTCRPSTNPRLDSTNPQEEKLTPTNHRFSGCALTAAGSANFAAVLTHLCESRKPVAQHMQAGARQ
jgi:hypothetical protein